MPYTSFSESNRFYQTFLFDSCLDYYFDSEWKLIYQEDLCSVSSDDEKTYTITLSTGMVWSNDEPITLDDVYFSYRYLLVDNVWDRQDLRSFSDVSVSKEDWYISVVFPESSPDNRVFFTHFVLPQSLGGVTYDDYVDTYLRLPVWSDCAGIYPQMWDDSNLVFDLSNCDDTYLLRYQLQLLDGLRWEDKQLVNDISADFYDLVSWGTFDREWLALTDFSHMSVPLREYAMVFFNTQSDKLSAKIQRALWWLIFHEFYADESYKDYLKRDHLGFDIFLSEGDSVDKYLIAKNPTISLDKYDLEKIDVTALPQKLDLAKNNGEVYFLEEVRWYKTVEIALWQSLQSLRVVHNDGEPYTPKTFEKWQDDFFYSLSVYNKNLNEWRNTYSVQTEKSGKREEIAWFETYYLTSPLGWDDDNIAEEDKIQVVYFVDDLSSSVVAKLQSIIAENDLDPYFTWNWYQDDDQFLWKISSTDYDIVIGTVDVGLREDLSWLFSSETPTVNPSLYVKESFVSLLSEYTQNESVRDTLMSIYSSDVPFIVLWQRFDSSFVRSPLVSYLPVEVQWVYHFKRQLYENVTFGVQRGFTWSDVFNKQNFRDFFNHL